MLIQKRILRRLDSDLTTPLKMVDRDMSQLNHMLKLHIHGTIHYGLYTIFNGVKHQVHGCLYYDILYRIMHYNKDKRNENE